MSTLQIYEWHERDGVPILRCACACGWSYQHSIPADVNREGAHHQEMHRWEAARRRRLLAGDAS